MYAPWLEDRRRLGVRVARIVSVQRYLARATQNKNCQISV